MEWKKLNIGGSKKASPKLEKKSGEFLSFFSHKISFLGLNYVIFLTFLVKINVCKVYLNLNNNGMLLYKNLKHKDE